MANINIAYYVSFLFGSLFGVISLLGSLSGISWFQVSAPDTAYTDSFIYNGQTASFTAYVAFSLDLTDFTLCDEYSSGQLILDQTLVDATGLVACFTNGYFHFLHFYCVIFFICVCRCCLRKMKQQRVQKNSKKRKQPWYRVLYFACEKNIYGISQFHKSHFRTN